MVVVGVGVAPRVDLAEAAGLKVDNGVVVDEHLETSAPGVYAAGRRRLGLAPALRRHLRVEHWANALNQGLTAGANAAGERERLHPAAVLLLRPVRPRHGVRRLRPSPDDALVVRGAWRTASSVVFWHRDGVVTAAMNVNVWDVVEDLKAIVAGGRPVDPARLADPRVPLAELAPS